MESETILEKLWHRQAVSIRIDPIDSSKIQFGWTYYTRLGKSEMEELIKELIELKDLLPD